MTIDSYPYRSVTWNISLLVYLMKKLPKTAAALTALFPILGEECTVLLRMRTHLASE